MAWVILVVAGLFEIAWAVGLKYTDGFTRLWPSVLTLIAITASMYLLAVAARTLPIGTAYAIWVGIGVAGTTLAGFTFLDEPVNAWRIFFVLLLMISVAGLKLTGS
ncbi:MAG: DMT family transporter [Phycisphaerales bacterium JB061]